MFIGASNAAHPSMDWDTARSLTASWIQSTALLEHAICKPLPLVHAADPVPDLSHLVAGDTLTTFVLPLIIDYRWVCIHLTRLKCLVFASWSVVITKLLHLFIITVATSVLPLVSGRRTITYKQTRRLPSTFNHAYACHAFLSLLLNGIVHIDGDGFADIPTDALLIAAEAAAYKKQLDATGKARRRQAITDHAKRHKSVLDPVHPHTNTTSLGEQSHQYYSAPTGMQTRRASLHSITKSMELSKDTANYRKPLVLLSPSKPTLIEPPNNPAPPPPGMAFSNAKTPTYPHCTSVHR